MTIEEFLSIVEVERKRDKTISIRDKLQEAIDEISEGLDNIGGKATLNLKINFQVERGDAINDPNVTTIINPQVTVKLPKRKIKTTLYHVGFEGHFSRQLPLFQQTDDQDTNNVIILNKAIGE
jgi:hypothetical protein